MLIKNPRTYEHRMQGKKGEVKEAFYNTLILVICILYVKENWFLLFSSIVIIFSYSRHW